MPANGPAAVPVLVVDDSDIAQTAICAVVEETPGFELVGVASSGREALTLVGSFGSPLLVLVDVFMPGLNGVETAQRIRREHPSVVVVLVTASPPPPSDEPSLVIEDKRNISPRWLTALWAAPRPSPASA